VKNAIKGGLYMKMQIKKSFIFLGIMAIVPPALGMDISFGVYQNQGGRTYQEDRWFVSKNKQFFAVFDGHGGSAMSEYAQQNMYENYQKACDCTVKSELQQCFEKTSENFIKNNPNETCGSTAVAVVVQGKDMYFANVGDSRAIHIRKKNIFQTKDHKCTDENERKRVQTQINNANKGKKRRAEIADTGDIHVPVVVNGENRKRRLAMSRSLGDKEYKQYGVVATPTVEKVTVQDGDIIVMASDGLWDMISSEDVRNFIQENKNLDETMLAEKLAEEARRIYDTGNIRRVPGYTFDNITVVVMTVNTPLPVQKKPIQKKVQNKVLSLWNTWQQNMYEYVGGLKKTKKQNNNLLSQLWITF